MKYQIEFTEEARDDLRWLRAFDQKIILRGVKDNLTNEPLTEARNRKPLEENPIAPWELRIQKFRIFYDVEKKNVVKIGAVGYKEHNILYIRGKERRL